MHRRDVGIYRRGAGDRSLDIVDHLALGQHAQVGGKVRRQVTGEVVVFVVVAPPYALDDELVFVDRKGVAGAQTYLSGRLAVVQQVGHAFVGLQDETVVFETDAAVSGQNPFALDLQIAGGIGPDEQRFVLRERLLANQTVGVVDFEF